MIREVSPIRTCQVFDDNKGEYQALLSNFLTKLWNAFYAGKNFMRKKNRFITTDHEKKSKIIVKSNDYYKLGSIQRWHFLRREMLF